MDGMGLSDAKLLSCMSSGKVLKGLYFQKDFNDSITPRSNLVEIPDNVQFFLPAIQETAETHEFFHQELSETFVRVLNNEGTSLAASFSSKVLLVLDSKQQVIKKLNGSKDPYFKKWLHRELCTTIFVPTASVHIEHTKRCKLSTPAMHKLQKLESCFQKTALNDEFLKQCEDFFIEFGSHYFVGTYHLGGRRKDSRIEDIKETNKKEGEEDKEHNKSPSINTTYEKYGGSVQHDDIGTWKRSLVEKPCNWFVIDKEESSAFNYRGVWKLIDRVKFKRQPEFSDALCEAWRKLTGLTIDPEIDGTDFLLESVVKVIEEKMDKDIFLMKCTENVLIQTGRKTTVSDMITRVMNKDSNETLVQGEEEIEKNLSSKTVTMEKFDITVARLFNEYSTKLDKTGNVMDSITSVLESEKLIPKQRVSDNSCDSSMNLSLSSSSSEEISIDRSSSGENADSDQKSNQNDSELATFYECHPNCKECLKCQWCPVCCKVEST